MFPMSSYRDRVYIIGDIILKLVEYGELNQTALISFCRLNLKKHRCVLHELEMNDLIRKSQLQSGKRIVIIYKPTQKGIEFCRRVIEPYQRMFPRKKNPVLLLIMGTKNTNMNIMKTNTKKKKRSLSAEANIK